MKIPEIPLSTASKSPKGDSKAWESVLPQSRISKNLGENWGRFIPVPSGMVGQQLEPDWKHLAYTLLQLQSTDNENQCLESSFPSNAESAGTQMRIGAGSPDWNWGRFVVAYGIVRNQL